MKKALVGALVMVALASGWQSEAESMVVDDLFYGGSDYGSPIGIVAEEDVIGTDEKYDVSRMDVSISPSTISVSIYSSFFDNIGSDPGPVVPGVPSVPGAYLGDFFISTDDWSPFGSASSFYNTDVAANGEDWEYVLVFDVHDGTSDAGDLNLYAVDDSRIIKSGPGVTQSYRLDQEVLYNVEGLDSLASLATGTWSISSGKDFLTLTISNDVLGLSLDDFAMRWTMTCANDIIEGGSSVPEPATVLLFGSGLLGLAGTGWRRKKK